MVIIKYFIYSLFFGVSINSQINAKAVFYETFVFIGTGKSFCHAFFSQLLFFKRSFAFWSIK
jgi:hypothetical protein